MTSAETEEHARLDHCRTRLQEALRRIEARLDEYARDVDAQRDYMWDARRDMDHIEKISARQSMEQSLQSADALKAQHGRLSKLKRSPYFGRFDFQRSGAAPGEAEAVYVGMHHFHDEVDGETLVYDWRAPIATMFYDYEPGPARYEAPSGEVAGRLQRKRQFRIRDGRMELMLETGLNVVDDVLQDELGRASDDGMKHIVATIQRDQNAIIRNEEAHTLIIQGVAGSGKTSIALHRIAFLLYRYKDSLSSDDILIISPNRVFADYIGNVLPELGEEQVGEIGMETLAGELLDDQYRFQTFAEQTERLLEKDDEAMKERIAAKASTDFLRNIDRYVEHIERTSFEAVDWRLGRMIVPAWFLDETWHRHRGLGLTERVARVVSGTEQQIGIHYNRDLETAERQTLREAVRGMARRVTLRQAYRDLFEWLGRPELFKPAGNRLEYADVFPLIYLKMRLEGVRNPHRDVKHLLIDEMQDYTPVQYAVLSRLFKCRKTVLGDAAQSVNPSGASTAEQIGRALRSADCVKLTRSYRSTWEIMQFANAIAPNPELEAMERHGELARVHLCKRPAEARATVLAEIQAFRDSAHNSLALITRTATQARRLHRSLEEAGVEARLLNAESTGFATGITVCTAPLAKGLEFDRVIIPDADNRNYQSELDRSLLYVACTRAMHRLAVIAVGAPSDLLPASDATASNGERQAEPLTDA